MVRCGGPEGPDPGALRAIILGSVPIIGIWAVLFGAIVPGTGRRVLLQFLSFSVFGLGVLAVARRGYVRLASALLVVTFWVGVTVSIVTAGGVRAPSFAGYAIAIVVAGLLLGGRAAAVTTVISVASGLACVIAQGQGLLPDAQYQITPIALWAGAMLVFAVVALVQGLGSRLAREALARAERELTERRHAESALAHALDEVRRLNADLEARVARRTVELSRANEDLSSSNREMEAFAYTVAHDLRAPLRAIDGFTEILAEELGPRLDSEAARHFRAVQTGARRMGRMIDDLLALSRLGRKRLDRRPLAAEDVRRIVEDVIADLRTTARGRSVEVSIGEMAPCHAESGLLRQAFANLCANAFKFTRERPLARIDITSCFAGDGPTYAIADNGIGFDMNHATKLFGVFQRLHPEVEFEGMGVGLATVRRIVERHGGKVWADARPGAGATFHFTIPPPPAG